MAFEFRLETLLTYRRNLEELAEQKLARELRILQGHKDHFARLKNTRVRMIEDFEARKLKAMTSAMFTFYAEAVRNKDREIIAQKTLIESQEQIIIQCRGELAEKVRGRKVIEKAREKDYKMYVAEIQRKELQDADEMAVLRYGREFAG